MNGARIAVYLGEVWCETPYIEAFVDDLKQAIPSRQRAWDKDRKLWHIARDYADVLGELLERHYGGWHQVDPGELGLGGRQRRPAAAAPAKAVDPWKVLCLTPEAPPDLIDLAYRFWAKRLHPDAGGDHTAMVRLNEAVSKVRR